MENVSIVKNIELNRNNIPNLLFFNFFYRFRQTSKNIIIIYYKFESKRLPRDRGNRRSEDQHVHAYY